MTFTAYLAVMLAQQPFSIAADTKWDLFTNPSGFLEKATYLWSDHSFMGTLHNQAYGYFFPHGFFFLLTDFLAVPPWISQRVWWALLLTIGTIGMARLLRAFIPASGIIIWPVAVLYALAPRNLTTLTTISSEALPVLLAPWVALPLLSLMGRKHAPNSTAIFMALSASIALACMGAVNAVATAWAVVPAIIVWLASIRGKYSWWPAYTLTWLVSSIMVCIWWLVPLLVLGTVSPPFLDYIESAEVTTRWASVGEILRGTSSWTPFVSSERIAGAAVTSSPILVGATMLLVAGGLAGLAHPKLPYRATWVITLLLGVLFMGAGFQTAAFSEETRQLLDSVLAPLRNIHKADPLVRMPLLIGLAFLLTRCQLPTSWRTHATRLGNVSAHPKYVVAVLVATAAVVSIAPVWNNKLVPADAVSHQPQHWAEAAAWLEHHAATHPSHRALIAPGSSFAKNLWGNTRDEPLQPLANSAWAVRDAIPLVPPEAIRMLDSIQRQIAAGRALPASAHTLAQAGFTHIVVRNDLNPLSANAPDMVSVSQWISSVRDVTKVAEFGQLVGPDVVRAGDALFVPDNGRYTRAPAIEIYEIQLPVHRAYRIDADQVPLVAASSDALATLDSVGITPGPRVLAHHAPPRFQGSGQFIATDFPAQRTTNFGRVDHNTSAILTDETPWKNYDSGAEHHSERLFSGAKITVSSSASDPNYVGGFDPSASAAAAFDRDPTTAWKSGGIASAWKEWIRVDLTQPKTRAVLTVRGTNTAVGPRVNSIDIRTNNGSTSGALSAEEDTVIPLPPGATTFIQISAASTVDGTAGNQFGIAEISLDSHEGPVDISSTITVPPPDTDHVDQWVLSQHLAQTDPCTGLGQQYVCTPSLGVRAEEPGKFSRVVTAVAEATHPAVVYLQPGFGGRLASTMGYGKERKVGTLDQVSVFAPPQEGEDSGQTDPRQSILAAFDNNPSTTWTVDPRYAKLPHKMAFSRPIALDTLRLTMPTNHTPAQPRKILVRGDNFADVVHVGKTETAIDVELGGRVFSELEFSILSSSTVTTSDPFTRKVQPGLSRIDLRSRSGKWLSDDVAVNHFETIEHSCSDGVAFMTIDGKRYGLRYSTTAAGIAAGHLITATTCSPIRLAQGDNALSVTPPMGMSVKAVHLSAQQTSPQVVVEKVEVTSWTPHERILQIPAAEKPQIVVVNQSTNPGWKATLGSAELTPIVVNGWQQGWIIPAHPRTQGLHLEFTPGSTYRLALLIGAVLLALVVIAWAIAWRIRQAPTGAIIHRCGNGKIGLMLAASASIWVLLPPLYAALASAMTVAGWWFSRTSTHKFLATLMTLTALCGLWMAKVPWGFRGANPGMYTGDDIIVQLMLVVALAIVAVSAPIASTSDAEAAR